MSCEHGTRAEFAGRWICFDCGAESRPVERAAVAPLVRTTIFRPGYFGRVA